MEEQKKSELHSKIDQKIDQGMRLIEKGQKGLARMIFSRVGVIILLLMVQVALMALFFIRLEEYLPHMLVISALFSVFMALYLLNTSTDPTAKITWLLVIVLMPAFGAPLYVFTRSDLGIRLMKKRLAFLMESTKDSIQQDPEVLEALKEKDPGAAALAKYMSRGSCCPVYSGTGTKYYPLGDDMWPDMLEDLESAKDFIFMEFFIIDEGLMWGKILEILAKKAQEGVDVRLMYDGTCEFSTLPHDYPARLQALGIKCKMFSPVTPFLSTSYNYRDHRKICVVDGKTAYTGGVNLADEYINHIERFGHWKDTALRVEGKAVASFTLLFLQMWCVYERELDIDRYEIDRYIKAPCPVPEDAGGFVIPYGDCPLDSDKVGERVYMDILNRAKDYVYIMSPYLILDGEMETALKFAAERGVDVRLVLPGIPDKITPWALAKTHYRSLLDSGVKIYEYSPGFVHAKVFVADDSQAVVGTINLDYRSLYHHFECAAYMHGCSCIKDIKADVLDTISKCAPVGKDFYTKEKFRLKLLGFIMKAVAPLI